MNGVDLANQLRQAYKIQRIGYRTWLPLFYWILNQAVVNAFQLGSFSKAWTGSHLSFREKLYKQLWAYASKLNSVKWREPGPHKWAVMRKSPCKWCAKLHALRREAAILLGQSTAATQILQDINAGKVVKRPSAIPSGCSYCEVNLCKRSDCWTQWHSQG